VAKSWWAAKAAEVAPAAVVFSSTDTESAWGTLDKAGSWLTTTRSGRPSPLTSPSATDLELVPMAKSWWEAKDRDESPGAVVFSSTDTVWSSTLKEIRSGGPSPLTSPSATELTICSPVQGVAPVAKSWRGAKVGAVAPGAVVFNSTDTVLS